MNCWASDPKVSLALVFELRLWRFCVEGSNLSSFHSHLAFAIERYSLKRRLKIVLISSRESFLESDCVTKRLQSVSSK